MTTKAVVEYVWVPGYAEYWFSDGHIMHILESEILPMIELHFQSSEKFYEEFLRHECLVSKDEYYGDIISYLYVISDLGNGKYKIDIDCYVVLRADAQKKELSIEDWLTDKEDREDILDDIKSATESAGWKFVS